MIDDPAEKYIINIEPQGYLDNAMPARMLRYRADIWEHTIQTGLGFPSIKQIVVYFFKEHDNKNYELCDMWDNENTLKFSYKAIKVWKMKKDIVINKNLIGLYPLLPLMEKESSKTGDEIIQETVTIIRTVQDEALQADLLAVTSILASEKFTSQLVKKYVRRSMLMNSSLFNEWVKEERKEAAEKAAKEATEKAAKNSAKKYILELLSEKFDFVPKNIRDNVDTVDDITILDELIRKIIKVNTIEEFRELLDKAMNI